MLFDRLGNPEPMDDGGWESFKADFLSAMRPTYEKRWRALGTDARELLPFIISGKKIQRSRQYVIRDLERKGYVGKESEGYPLKPEAFARYAESVCCDTAVPGKGKIKWFKRLFG